MKKFALVLTLVTTSAFALTLKEKKQLADWQEGLANPNSSDFYAGTFKTRCGYDLPVKIDEKMVTPFMEKGYSLAAYCDAPRSQMSSMCESDKMYKEAISKKVKAVSCKFSSKPEDLSFKLAGTTLEVTMGLETANIESKTKEWLENNL